MSFNRSVNLCKCHHNQDIEYYPLNLYTPSQSVPSHCPQIASDLLCITIDECCLAKVSYKWKPRICVALVHHIFLRVLHVGVCAVSVVHSFLLLSDTLLRGFTAFSLPTYLSRGV